MIDYIPNNKENNKFTTSRYKRSFYSYVFPKLNREEKELIKFINFCQEKSISER